MADFNPREIKGCWAEGYVLDLHTSSSTYLGDDPFGHPQFDTRRTEIGELLYRLKYHSDKSTIDELAEAAISFLKSWGVNPSLVVPKARSLQPVPALAREIAARLGVPAACDAMKKKESLPELKDVADPTARRTILEGAFTVDQAAVKGHSILLVDDLYRSGATMNAIAKSLIAAGAKVIYAFAFTQTRSRT